MERIILTIYKNAKKVAEMDITDTPKPEREAIFWSQEILGRTWKIERIKDSE